jgi:hypothetical protein
MVHAHAAQSCHTTSTCFHGTANNGRGSRLTQQTGRMVSTDSTEVEDELPIDKEICKRK